MINKNKKNAQEFVKKWEGRGYEKGESQTFWNTLLRDVLDVSNPEDFIEYEDQVVLDSSTGFIDGYIPSSRVLIEQKSANKELNKKVRQSDGSLLTPYQQAVKYRGSLPFSKQPRWIITCNFKEFNIYDMENPKGEPEILFLKDLPKEYYRLSFITDSENSHIRKEMELSLKAGDIVGELYDVFSKQYYNLETDLHEQRSLNQLIVRIVFCLYAEDAGLFKFKNQFHDYLAKFSASGLRMELISLFKILDQKENERDPYLNKELLQFPYVNGGLFSDETIIIPQINDEIKNLLLAKASDDFDWSEISPTIFGAVFECTLNPETRRNGGMHYTSIENIHKVIDPLFLDDLTAELNEIRELKQRVIIEKRVLEFQEKISNLYFLDPAAGSGNFLTEAYISLRRLENEALTISHRNQMTLIDPIKVSISQFYGIEINDFAVSVAQTALWIAESQMKKQTEDLFNFNLDYLPLKSFSNIHEGNALKLDWKDVINPTKLSYIIGNPPFVGSKYSSTSQKKDMDFVFENNKKIKYRTLDYVSCWYYLAAKYIQNTNIKCAFVSTNSITQGEQTEILWKPLFDLGIKIDFAYKTFRWDSEANIKAHVHCIIIGFSHSDVLTKKPKYIYDNGLKTIATNINAYLIDAPNIFVSSSNKPLFGQRKMVAPNKPCDYNNLKIEAKDYPDFIKKCPESKKWIKKMVGADEFINNKERYCLWLVGCTPNELKQMPLVLDRVNKCREARLKANTAESIKLADTPMLFREQLNPEEYLIIPCVSSEKRRYIPIGFLDSSTIPVMGTLIIPNATFYEFGILTSNVHMAWMRAVAGRLEMRYRYSKDIVYNNFPLPTCTEKQKLRIEKSAEQILKARVKYDGCTLADMYGEQMYLYPELLKAHQENDSAVMEAYNFSTKMTESECVAELMKMYKELVD